jgi:4-diphosphocytidyl-2-C-methyl-D-erythritol kinase
MRRGIPKLPTPATDMQRIELQAHAKINLTLEVLGKRTDGYHEIASIIQTIGLYDTLTLEPADELTLECATPGLSADDNLVLKAATMLREAAGVSQGATIMLQKSIPVSAGLGGGSSDAAAALIGLNRLWETALSDDALHGIAARLGSDVPFFLRGGTAMAHGRGELIRSLPPADIPWVVVLSPDIPMPDKTAALYAALPPAQHTGGLLTRKLEARIRGGGDVPPQFLFNVFDNVVREAFPGLDEYWDAFTALGAREVHVAGSGPSLFAPVSRRELGTALALMLSHKHGWVAHAVPLWQPPEEGPR